MDFYDLDLDDYVLDALDAMGFETCTPIQEKTIPEVLNGKDIIGVAQTGTGKTAAYLLPVLSRLCSGDYPEDAINCIIMAPTRELSQQIDQSMEGFSYYMPVSSLAIYGGNDGIRFEQERRSLEKGADVIIATPGRLLSHIKMGHVDFSRVSFFILDEADRMLDMGFVDDIMQIEKLLPKKRQTIMLSATMPAKIQQLAKNILTNPVEIKLAVSKPAEKINQKAYYCTEHEKLAVLKHLFETEEQERVIIFASSKKKVKEVARTLKMMHLNVGEMHSDLTQEQRDEVMYAFKANQVKILVATDIVARGIDIDDIQMVINYDVPHEAEDYVHRIGRTARANRNGKAVTLVSPGKERMIFKKIEAFLKKEVERGEWTSSATEEETNHSKQTKHETRRRRTNDARSNRASNQRQSNRKANHTAGMDSVSTDKIIGDNPGDTNQVDCADIHSVLEDKEKAAPVKKKKKFWNKRRNTKKNDAVASNNNVPNNNVPNNNASNNNVSNNNASNNNGATTETQAHD